MTSRDAGPLQLAARAVVRLGFVRFFTEMFQGLLFFPLLPQQGKARQSSHRVGWGCPWGFSCLHNVVAISAIFPVQVLHQPPTLALGQERAVTSHLPSGVYSVNFTRLEMCLIPVP